MPFLTYCTNKGCGKHQEPYLDTKDNNIYCSVCEKEITGLSSFAKTQMKFFGQIKKATKQAHTVKCNKCKIDAVPNLVDNILVCSSCNSKIEGLSTIFYNFIKSKLQESSDDND